MTSGEDNEFSISYQKRKGRGNVSFLFVKSPTGRCLIYRSTNRF